MFLRKYNAIVKIVTFIRALLKHNKVRQAFHEIHPDINSNIWVSIERILIKLDSKCDEINNKQIKEHPAINILFKEEPERTAARYTYNPAENAPSWWPATITEHTVDRYNEHFPGSGIYAVLWDLAHGIEIPVEIIMSVFVRNNSHDGDIYILSKDKTGVFVLKDGSRNLNHNSFTVTYLRLCDEQKKFFEINY